MLNSLEVKVYIDNLNDEKVLTELSDCIRRKQKEISDHKWEKVDRLFDEMMEKAREINETGFDITIKGNIIDIDDLGLEVL